MAKLDRERHCLQRRHSLRLPALDLPDRSRCEWRPAGVEFGLYRRGLIARLIPRVTAGFSCPRVTFRSAPCVAAPDGGPLR